MWVWQAEEVEKVVTNKLYRQILFHYTKRREHIQLDDDGGSGWMSCHAIVKFMRLWVKLFDGNWFRVNAMFAKLASSTGRKQ